MVQQPDLEHDMDAQLASQLEQMGLPAGFSTSKGQSGEEIDTGLDCITEEASQAGAASSYEDMCSYLESNCDLNDNAPQQGGACAWQQAYDGTYGCFYYYCERTQETTWEPPAEGYLPIPLEWLPNFTQDTLMHPDTQSDSEAEQQAQANSAYDCVIQPDGDLSHELSAAHLSAVNSQQELHHQQAASDLNASSEGEIYTHLQKQQHTRSSQPLRPESSGLMSSIPEPQGTHVRFDNDTPSQQSFAKDAAALPSSHPSNATVVEIADSTNSSPTAACIHSSSAHEAGTAQSSRWEPEAIETTAAQQAVKSIMSSTVIAAEPVQQAAELSNVVPDVPSALPHALQAMANTYDEPPVSANTPEQHHWALQDVITQRSLHADAVAQDNHSSEQVGTDMATSDDGNHPTTDADELGITFQSLSNQLQSKRELPRKLWKYWLQRYSLFQRFDEGILMDEEGWYSATPEVIAAHQAIKCRCSVIVDAFAGVGGNAIQFALTCDRVIAVELSAQRIEIARHNADVYGVAHKIHFICGDFLALAHTLQADVVFLSPPWGGPAYSKSGLFDASQSIGSLGQNLSQLMKTASTALRQPESQRIACFLPRNTSLLALSDTTHVQEGVVERNVLNGHLKAVTVYYGDLATG